MRTACGRRRRSAFLCLLLVGAAAEASLLSFKAAPQRRRVESRREHQRDAWQRVDDIFQAMKLAPGARVADVGAGGGFFTVRLSRAVGAAGRVYAVDVNGRVVEDLRARVAREQLVNVEVIRGDDDNPGLPAGLDAVLIVNAYHEMNAYRDMLARIRDALRPGGRLVIVEPISERREEASRRRQTGRHEIAADYVAADLEEAGFAIELRIDRFVERPQDNDVEWLIAAIPRSSP